LHSFYICDGGDQKSIHALDGTVLHRSSRKCMPCECHENQRKRCSFLKSISRFRKNSSLMLHNEFSTCCVKMQSCFTQCVVHPLGNPGSNPNVTARSRKQHNTMRALVHTLNLQLHKRSAIDLRPTCNHCHACLCENKTRLGSYMLPLTNSGFTEVGMDSNWIWEEEWCAPQPSIGLAGDVV
jgi:hypothetical protein